MPTPKQRHTKSRRNRQRSHHALSGQKLSPCPKCGALVMSHRLCVNCGTYAGKEVVDVLAKLTKKERKKKEKELAEKEQAAAETKSLNAAELSK